MTHRCETSTDPTDTPLTRSRVRRILAAMLPTPPDEPALEAVLADIGGCTNCLTHVALMSVGMVIKALPNKELHDLAATDQQMEAAADEHQADEARREEHP